MRLPQIPAGLTAWTSTGTPAVFAGYSASDAWTGYADSVANPIPAKTSGSRTTSTTRY